MKPFIISKLSIVLLCLGGTLLLSPQSRAQSDIAPDHFDGTDSWAAAPKAPAAQAKSHSAPVILQASSISAAPKLEPVAAHEVTAPRRSKAIANKKRKPTTNSNN
jgi:hypothetical protein